MSMEVLVSADRLKAILQDNKNLREGLEKARDTFTDFAITLKTLGHPHMATAAQIAEEATQRILKGEKE